MSISDAVQDILYNDATVQSIVSSFTQSATTYYMVFGSSLIPKKLGTDSGDLEPDVRETTVNHYHSGTISGGSMVINTSYSVTCRAYNESDALALQEACYSALNRVKSSDGKYFFVASKLQVITPIDDNDNYNAQVELNVKGANC